MRVLISIEGEQASGKTRLANKIHELLKEDGEWSIKKIDLLELSRESREIHVFEIVPLVVSDAPKSH